MYRNHKIRILSENLTRTLITEGAETRNMSAAKHYLYDKLGCSEQQAMQYIGQIKTDIPNSRLAKCKFMLGIVRMFCDRELQDGSTIMKLNQSLKYAASDAHVNEYNQDLNGMSAQEIVSRFAGSAKSDLEQDKADISSEQYDESSSQYEIVRINSFEEAQEYSDYVDWCVTYDSNMYDSYTNGGYGVFYFCLRNGFEKEERVEGENSPLDSYGLSMIAVSVNDDGSCNTITCRWNHANGGNDHVMSPKELSQVVGRNFYQTFKPLTEEEIIQKKEAKIREVEEYIDAEIESYGLEKFLTQICNYQEYDPDNGDEINVNVAVYDCVKGMVLVNDRGEIISDIYEKIEYRTGDMMVVQLQDKFNFINVNGELLSNTWYVGIRNYFHMGYGLVVTNTLKENLIDKDGNLVFDKPYDSIETIERGGRGIAKTCVVWYKVNGDYEGYVYNLEKREYIFTNPVVYCNNISDKHFFLRFKGDKVTYVYTKNTMKPVNPDVYAFVDIKYNCKNNYFVVIDTKGRSLIMERDLELYSDNPSNNDRRQMEGMDRLSRIVDNTVRELLEARHAVGGNSGYVGYSMSKRAANARSEGRFPKGDFRKAYGMTEKTLEALVDAGIVDDSEWHHTSMYGNRTTFYAWDEPWMAQVYAANKKEIDRLSRTRGEGFIQQIQDIFDNSEESKQAEIEREERLRKAQEEVKRQDRIRELQSEYKKEFPINDRYELSNGVQVRTFRGFNNWEYYKDGQLLNRNNDPDKVIRSQARQELEKILERPSFEEWLKAKGGEK